MTTEEQRQIADRARKLAAQVDKTTIAMRRRTRETKTTELTPHEAIDYLLAVAPLAQAIVRYQLALIDVVRDADYATRTEIEDDNQS
jgi:hypothetical protein